MKPQLAKDTPLDADGNLKVKFPLFAQAKLDGIRCVIVDGKPMSRKLKEIPNRAIFEALSQPELEGLDGELIVGDPYAPGCFQRTSSGVMSRDGEPDWTYYVFDVWNHDGNMVNRRIALTQLFHRPTFAYRISPERMIRIKILDSTLIKNIEELEAFEANEITKGGEGIITRNPYAFYKFGRAGTTNAECMKIKRFKDGEARIIGLFERMHNANEAKTDALGRTERSSHKANKIGRGDLGGFQVEDIITGQRFKVGTGFNDEQRTNWWGDDTLINKTIKYKFFEVGTKDLPRFPVFQGFRDERDM